MMRETSACLRVLVFCFLVLVLYFYPYQPRIFNRECFCPQGYTLNRKIKLVGIDTASIDYGQSKFYETHQILYKENIPGLESVANMDKLPVKGFTLYAAPMFITGGSGGPRRTFARVDENDGKDCIKSGAVRFQGEVMYIGITFLLLGLLKLF